MSAEVKQLLRQAEIDAERTLAYVRCGIALSACVFFLGIVVPSFAPDDPALKQVPYVAMYAVGYFVVGLATFHFTHPDRFQRWTTWVFTTLDIIFWSILMIAAVINLDLPPSYVLALPPTLLLFVVLALVTLRSNPMLQAYALFLLMTVLFLLFLLAGETFSEPTDDPELLSRLFLVPPNFARLTMIGLAGSVLIFATIRTRQLLNRAVVETAGRANLSRYLPAQLSDRLVDIDQNKLMSGTTQEAAILFVDIRGFTRLAENMEPGALSRFLAEYRQIVSDSVHNHHGIVDKYVGDSVMAVFGAPDSHGDDARNALNCATEILDAIAQWNTERRRSNKTNIKVGIGVHWGSVFCGTIGDSNRLEFTVLGDAVNVAAKLEQLTKEAGFPVVTSGDLLSKADVKILEDSSWTTIGDTEIGGRSGRIELFGKL